MEQKKLGQLLVAWFRTRVKIISLYLLLMSLYWVVAILSHSKLSPIGYSTYLGIFIGVWIAILDFIKYFKKYKCLLTVYKNKEITVEHLPVAKDLLEVTYQGIIQELYTYQRGIKLQATKQLSEMNDYYTLWAHQIKTPIAAMNLLIQEETKVYELELELFKIEQYVEMVLQYLRLESMSSDLILCEYSLYNIVKQAVKKYAIAFIGNKVSLEFEPFDGKVITDEKWILFVVEQILSNSLKYTHNGKISIRIEGDKHKVLVISDTGIGISSEDLPRICERGFTGYNGRMNKKSTGIGLYLCKEVVDKLGHTLEVRSRVGEGTTVRIGFIGNG